MAILEVGGDGVPRTPARRPPPLQVFVEGESPARLTTAVVEVLISVQQAARLFTGGRRRPMLVIASEPCRYWA